MEQAIQAPRSCSDWRSCAATRAVVEACLEAVCRTHFRFTRELENLGAVARASASREQMAYFIDSAKVPNRSPTAALQPRQLPGERVGCLNELGTRRGMAHKRPGNSRAPTSCTCQQTRGRPECSPSRHGYQRHCQMQAHGRSMNVLGLSADQHPGGAGAAAGRGAEPEAAAVGVGAGRQAPGG